MPEKILDLEESTVAGDLGVLHLKRLWSRCLRERYGMTNDNSRSDEWSLDNVIYHGLNLPIEETIAFLYHATPSFTEFENWILAKNAGIIHKNSVDRINAAINGLLSGDSVVNKNELLDPILTNGELEFWEQNGYLVVPGLYADDDVKAAETAVWQHLQMHPDDPETWYRRESDHGIMVQFFYHPALDAIRRSPKLTRVFAQLWKTSDLWTSTDRVSFNPPERPGRPFQGPRLHWDVSLELPIPFGIQGLVYLTDTEAEQGAFTCVPGFHKVIDGWIRSLPSGVNPRDEDIERLGAVPIPGNAGDLIIWHQALPHGSRPNRMTGPRIVEYVTMFPACATYAENWR